MAKVIDLVIKRVGVEALAEQREKHAAELATLCVEAARVPPAAVANVMMCKMKQLADAQEASVIVSLTMTPVEVFTQKAQGRKVGQSWNGLLKYIPSRVSGVRTVLEEHVWVHGDYMYTHLVPVGRKQSDRYPLDAGVFRVEKPLSYNGETDHDSTKRWNGFWKLHPVSAHLVDTWKDKIPFIWRNVNNPELSGYQYWIDPSLPGRKEFIDLSPHFYYFTKWHGVSDPDRKYLFGLPLEFGVTWWDITPSAWGATFDVTPMGTLDYFSDDMRLALETLEMRAIPGLNPIVMDPHSGGVLGSCFRSVFTGLVATDTNAALAAADDASPGVIAAAGVKLWVEQTLGVRNAEWRVLQDARAWQVLRELTPPILLGGSEEEEEEEEETTDQLSAKMFAPVHAAAAKVDVLQTQLKWAVQLQHDLVEEALDSVPSGARADSIAYFKKRRLM